ncbi:MAG: menaquinol-cytochrome c reductase iron-sulfur subunit [Acidobacteriota bacterium]|jgi:Rieske Fe-S protein|nr:menaquinol-cytochrome c reductase iron-sulfur subunit [Acidobacteriota bacterium]
MTTTEPSPKHKDREPDKGRRQILFLIPFGIFAAITGTVVTAAYRFLRPAKTAEKADWSDIGPMEELKGEKPIRRSVVTEHQSGWANTVEEHFVYILPNKGNTVLSSICPHEGCNVEWRAEDNEFVCPCHDSYFTSDGERSRGPSQRGLDPLPTREKEGVLQVKYQTYVNNTEERIVRR